MRPLGQIEQCFRSILRGRVEERAKMEPKVTQNDGIGCLAGGLATLLGGKKGEGTLENPIEMTTDLI